jgi:hypothetical protein
LVSGSRMLPDEGQSASTSLGKKSRIAARLTNALDFAGTKGPAGSEESNHTDCSKAALDAAPIFPEQGSWPSSFRLRLCADCLA